MIYKLVPSDLTKSVYLCNIFEGTDGTDVNTVVFWPVNSQYKISSGYVKSLILQSTIDNKFFFSMQQWSDKWIHGIYHVGLDNEILGLLVTEQ